jgi:Protein of unknown function (DUF3485)
MKRTKLILSVVVLTLILGTAVLLAVVPQKLGAPGVKAKPVPGSTRWQVYLPEQVLGYSSINQEPNEKTIMMLPSDTSIAERVYSKPGATPITLGVVLMGTDRTSIHKAEYCMQGEGLHLDEITRETVPLSQPLAYNLPIIKILATYNVPVGGKTITKRCLYVYWYVADGALSNDRSGMERMWSMARKLAVTGVLQRWAYVRFYAFCDPGQEEATFQEIKRFIVDAVPQFQLTPQPPNSMGLRSLDGEKVRTQSAEDCIEGRNLLIANKTRSS